MPEIDRVAGDEAERFVHIMLEKLKYPSLDQLPALAKSAVPLHATVIRDVRAVSASERDQLRSDFYSPAGVAYFVTEEQTDQLHEHPIFTLAAQLQRDLPLSYPIPHPLETSARLILLCHFSGG